MFGAKQHGAAPAGQYWRGSAGIMAEIVLRTHDNLALNLLPQGADAAAGDGGEDET